MLAVAGFLILALVAVAAVVLTVGAVRGAGSATRLVVYGSLAPGEANHHVLDGISGEWRACVITGTVEMHDGYRIFRWARDGDRIAAQMLISQDLPRNWLRLDEFEGGDYRRIVIPAEVGGRRVFANVYTDARKVRTRPEIRS